MKLLVVLSLMAGVLALSSSNLDVHLRTTLNTKGLEPLTKPELEKSKVELGQKLFFDKILSGNRDISCATCHHPSLHSSDGLRLPIGVGGKGLGPERILGYDRTLIPRNSPDIFNRGHKEWRTMFWDSRVSGSQAEGFITPADEKLPEGFDNVLAVQAMFPVLSRDEMRGEIGDVDVFGTENELALISDAAPQSVWAAIMKRVLNVPEYQKLFQEAYPHVSTDELGFQHAANAIAAFEIDAFTMLDSPWDRYLRGDDGALSAKEKQGATLFYGKAGCDRCHSGDLMTDQKHHNIGIPQFGPGKGNAAPLDVGRFLETGKRTDRFAFRTPPLRNVTHTAPYMHNGAFIDLKDAILHHLDPENSLRQYSPEQIPPEMRASYQDNKDLEDRMIASIDSYLRVPLYLADEEVEALTAFMFALTDDGMERINESLIYSVPSGLPVD